MFACVKLAFRRVCCVYGLDCKNSIIHLSQPCVFLYTYLYLSGFYYGPSDEPGGGDKASEEKRKDQSTPVLSPSQGSPEAKEER